MLIYYSLVKRLNLRLLFIFGIMLIIKCDGINSRYLSEEKNACPFIEILSFGSDIDIKCNDTYLIFNEINTKRVNWKFANESAYCDQKGKQQGFVNHCNITRMDSSYLKVTLKSLYLNEYACVYCPINYKPIAPMISVTQSNHPRYSSYTFTLTATGLNRDESFEILWAKRVKKYSQDSINYWFLQRCIDDHVVIHDDTGHTIKFDVDDADISRVEFIIRRCNGTCRRYRRCDPREPFDAVSWNNFQIPDSIEKISCDYDCLNGIVSTIMTTIPTENLLLTTQQLSHEKQTMKFLILFSLLAVLIVLLLILLGWFIISRIKGLRTDNIYTKTSNINMDENKETVE